MSFGQSFQFVQVSKCTLYNGIEVKSGTNLCRTLRRTGETVYKYATVQALGKTPYWSKQVIASIASTANSDVTKIFAVHDVATAEDFTFLRFQGAPFIGRT